MTEFTFGVLTYNSASTVIETLESIKYQIEHYGEGIKFFLIVSDDCSSDNTMFLVNKWMEINRALFFEVKALSTSINSGICANYALLINSIQTEFFLPISGDDLVSSVNVLESVSNLGQYEIRIYLPILYNGEDVFISEKNIARQLFYKEYGHSNKKDIHLLETLNPYSSPEVTFLRQHYSTESMEFIKQYRNFEDDTSLYYILRNNRKVKFVFKIEPLVIYRKSGESLTTSVDNSNQIKFLDDLYKFRKLTMKEEKNVIIKIFLLLSVWHHFLIKHRFDASRTLYKRIKNHIEKKRIKTGMRHLSFTEYNESIHLFLQEEKQYLIQMKSNSDAFIKYLQE